MKLCSEWNFIISSISQQFIWIHDSTLSSWTTERWMRPSIHFHFCIRFCCCSVAQSCPTATPWIAACQASLSFTISQSLLKLMSIELVMPSNHLIMLPSSPPALNFSQHQSLFQWIGSSHQVPRVLELRFSISPSNGYSGLISFRINWFDLLAVQGTLKRLLQQHSLKPSILWHSAFFMVQLSHPYMTTGKATALTRQTFVGKVMSLLFNMLPRLVIVICGDSERKLGDPESWVSPHLTGCWPHHLEQAIRPLELVKMRMRMVPASYVCCES